MEYTTLAAIILGIIVSSAYIMKQRKDKDN